MKSKTKKLFLSLFAFASLAITACSGNNGGSSGAGDSSGSDTTSSESGSGSDSSTTSGADVDTNLYVKVDNGEEQTIAYDEDEGTYTIGPVELTTSQVIEIYIKEDGVKQSALDIIDVETGSVAYLDVDEDEGTVSVTSDGTYTFVFTYDDGELSLAITKEADPSQEGYAVKINNEFKALVVASIDPTGEEDVTEKYKIENLSLSANDEVSFYKDGEVLAVLSDKEDSTNVNNINEHSVETDTTTPFTIHNDATAGIYFKHRVGTDPAPYDGWRFWITGYQGEPPIPPVSNKALHIKRGTADTPVALVTNPGNEDEVMATGVALQAGDSIYIDMGNDDYRGYADLKAAGASAYFLDDTEDHHNLKVDTGKAGNYDFYINKTKGEGNSVVVIKPRTGDETTTNFAASLGTDFGGTHVVYYHAWGTFGSETEQLTDLSVLPVKSDVSQFVLVSFAPGTTEFDWDHKLTQTIDVTPSATASAVFTIDTVGTTTVKTTCHWAGEAPSPTSFATTYRAAYGTEGGSEATWAWDDAITGVTVADPLYKDQAKYEVTLTAGQALKLRPQTTGDWYGFSELDASYPFATAGTDNNILLEAGTYDVYLKQLVLDDSIKIGLYKHGVATNITFDATTIDDFVTTSTDVLYAWAWGGEYGGGRLVPATGKASITLNNNAYGFKLLTTATAVPEANYDTYPSATVTDSVNISVVKTGKLIYSSEFNKFYYEGDPVPTGVVVNIIEPGSTFTDGCYVYAWAWQEGVGGNKLYAYDATNKKFTLNEGANRIIILRLKEEPSDLNTWPGDSSYHNRTVDITIVSDKTLQLSWNNTYMNYEWVTPAP